MAQVNTWLHFRFLPGSVPVVATIHHAVHHPDASVYKGTARAAYHRFWIAPNERRVLRRADRIVAVSRFVADTARQTLMDMPMQVIYNGVDTDRWQAGNRQRRAHEPFRLLYVGGWKRLKGVDLLAPIMRELGNGFELRYTGGTAAARDRRDWPNNMHDIGRLQSDPAVIAAMQEADALLFPSRSEGFGLVAAEAMACGLPVIAVQASSMPEIVADGVTGILCRQDDVVMFANAARTLAHDGTLRGKISQQARALASQKFSMDAMCSAYEKVYAACISNRPLVARPT
ncbi:MAG TPA: glycosyltransferase family 4 protein [Gammaproteobacteria bacterium]|nr:glycosyltransferase family 4 protein [Gammaproteobacteria bacterium]